MRVIMYKSSDGELHDSHEKFLKHEARMVIIKDAALLWPHVVVHDDSRMFSDKSIPIFRFVADNADHLRNVLNNAMSVKRVKKAIKASV
jgi:hypothetical protein